MTDYWKSNEKHFCDFCKCWTAANRASIEFHERGKNHQANVKKRLSEIKRNQIDKRKKDDASKRMFQQMEKAALAAAQKDMTSGENSFGKSDMKKIIESQTNPNEKSTDNSTYPWKAMAGPQGLTYYYNSLTGESTWQMPEVFKDLKEKEEKEKRDKKNSSSTKKSKKATQKDPYKPEMAIKKSESEVHSVHPLLGGWSTLPTFEHDGSDEEKKDEDGDKKEADVNEDDHDEHDGATSENNDSTQARELGRKFKEKTLKLSLSNDDEQPTSFKKRKSVKRNVRKRDDDD